MVAAQSATVVPVPGVRRADSAAGARAATLPATATATSGQTNMKLTPGSFHVTSRVRALQTINAPRCAPAADAHRRASAQPPRAMASARTASAAVYTPRNAGAPPHTMAACARAIAVPASIVTPAASAVEITVTPAP